MWKKDAVELLHSGWAGLLPLVPLTRGGTEHGIVEEMIAGLLSAGKTELLVVANALASLAFEQESAAEQVWLERTFAMLNDTLRNTKAYQKILKEGRERGREEGLEEGLEGQDGEQLVAREVLPAPHRRVRGQGLPGEGECLPGHRPRRLGHRGCWLHVTLEPVTRPKDSTEQPRSSSTFRTSRFLVFRLTQLR